jgi:hypothetical protein
MFAEQKNRKPETTLGGVNNWPVRRTNFARVFPRARDLQKQLRDQ